MLFSSGWTTSYWLGLVFSPWLCSLGYRCTTTTLAPWFEGLPQQCHPPKKYGNMLMVPFFFQPPCFTANLSTSMGPLKICWIRGMQMPGYFSVTTRGWICRLYWGEISHVQLRDFPPLTVLQLLKSVLETQIIRTPSPNWQFDQFAKNGNFSKVRGWHPEAMIESGKTFLWFNI